MIHQRSILYISPEPYVIGHASYTHVYEITTELAKFNWDISLITPRYKHAVSLLNRFKQLVKINFQTFFTNKPLIYMRWHVALFPTFLINKLRGKIIVVEVNGKTDDLFIAWKNLFILKPILKKMMIYQIQNASGIITVTPDLLLYCGSFNNIKSEPICISNGVNTTLFNIEAKHLELPENIRLPENFGILYGSLTEWQGIKKIVQSLESDLWQKSIHVVFIGKGKEVESALIKISAEKNKHIHYYENIDYRIIARIIARAKFSFVCGENINNRASHGLAPLKLFESIACGVPIIATNQPFQSEVVIENNLGLVLAELNNLNIFNAVTYLVNNPLEAQKMGSNGARCAKLYYGWDKKAEQTNSYLENLCLKFHS